MKVLLSAGHGGTDPGCIAVDGTTEHTLAAEQGNLIAKYLLAWGHEVTVQVEEYSANNFRVNDRQGADVAISLHFNSYNGKATGTEVLWLNYNSVASRILSSIVSVLGLPNRGLKRRSDLYVLFNNGFDCLVETCFVDNASDYRAYQSKKEEIAKSIAFAIMDKPMPKESKSHWTKENGHKYFIKADGKKAKGYCRVGQDYYFFNEEGVMCTGAFEIDGRLYNFDKDGKAKYGWEQFNGNLYFFDINGRSARGLVFIRNDQYYFDPKTSIMQTGKHKVQLEFGKDGKRILK